MTLCDLIGKSFVSRSRTIPTKALKAISLERVKEQNKILPVVSKHYITMNTVTWMISAYSYFKLCPNRIFIKRVCAEHPLINQRERNRKQLLILSSKNQDTQKKNYISRIPNPFGRVIIYSSCHPITHSIRYIVWFLKSILHNYDFVIECNKRMNNNANILHNNGRSFVFSSGV